MKINPEIVHEEMVLRNQALEEYYRNRVLFLAQTVANQKKQIDDLTPPVMNNEIEKEGDLDGRSS